MHAHGHRRARPEDRARGQRAKGVAPEGVRRRDQRALPRGVAEARRASRTTSSARPSRVTKSSCRSSGRRVAKNGDLYLGEYEGWYCVGCESFKTEKELLARQPLPAPPDKPVERVKEETYFFQLAKCAEAAPRLLRATPGASSSPRRGATRSSRFVEGRPARSLGVAHDLLVGHPRAGQSEARDVRVVRRARELPERARRRRARASSGRRTARSCTSSARTSSASTRCTGRRSCLSAGSADELPTKVFAHGFLTVDGQKMSQVAAQRGRSAAPRGDGARRPDVLRYHLLRAIAFGQDGDFDHAALLERYNADLGKNLGNLLSRTLGLCAKMTGGKVPATANRPSSSASSTKQRTTRTSRPPRTRGTSSRRTARSRRRGRSRRARTSTSIAPRRGPRRRRATRRASTRSSRTLLEVLEALSVHAVAGDAREERRDARAARLCRRSARDRQAISGRRRSRSIAPGTRSARRARSFRRSTRTPRRSCSRSCVPKVEAATKRRRAEAAVAAVIRAAAPAGDDDRVRRLREGRPARRRREDVREGPEEGQAPPARRSTSARPSRARSSPASRSRSRPSSSSGSASSSSRTSRRASSARASSRTACCSRPARARSSSSRPSRRPSRRARS